MATLVLEYDARNSTVQRLVEGLLSSGLFRVQSEQEKERIEIQKNMRTARKMIEDIRMNGSSKYQNMDSFLIDIYDKSEQTTMQDFEYLKIAKEFMWKKKKR